MKTIYTSLVALFVMICGPGGAEDTPSATDSNDAPSYHLQHFDRVELTATYYSEGTNVGDLNRDGHPDVVHGPYWFAGPDFKSKREIYQPVPQNTEGYANSFFSWCYDFNADGWEDILAVGFPGTAAYVYENPGERGHAAHWPKHEIFDWVSNESPQWTNLVGDDRPELICTRDGFFGYVTPNWEQPFQKWTFHRISEQVAAKRFGHGLGVGDVNGDGRQDVLAQNGWYEQPKTLGGPWSFHAFAFARAGGADIVVYDVDGDGDNDVISSLDAHGFGLAWYEQVSDAGQIDFRPHPIMGNKAEDNDYGVVFTELHSLTLADIDGDGLKDICTGKTYYSHHKGAPMWDAGAVVYWFKLERTEDGVRWIPYEADGEAGIGRQLIVADVNRDRLPDFVSGGMKGCHVMLQRRTQATRSEWLRAQPHRRKAMADGLQPPDAARQMTVPPGFHVQLAAGEPMIHQPVAFTFDHRGRVWVAEAYTYPVRAPDGQGKDKIIILEDTDQDGTLDTRKEFATGLNLVSGLEVGFGGVWVGAAPYLLFIPDRDQDDVPDSEPRVLLDGFGYQDTHETLNAFIWGPDGWLYGCHGVFTHSRVGKPGLPDGDRVPLNAGVWRYHPTRHEFDVFARGTSNPWGLDFDDHGQAFITACVIPHLWHVIQGARYQRQGGTHFNPHLYDDIKTIADHSHYTGNIRDSAWWGHEPELSDSVSKVGGGHAHCGAMIYLGDNWPGEFRNSIYFNNIHGNRVNNDILERRGSGYVGHHGKDFLFANDKWYRGINLKYGPDGSVHLIDWYDKNACHRVNPEIWDRSNGRIYRVRYGDVQPPRVDLATATDLELVELQSHDNDWYVRTARRLLQERAATREIDKDATQRLIETLTSRKPAATRLRALWTLHVIGDLSPDLIHALADDHDEYLRAWAIQLGVPEVLPGGALPSFPEHVIQKLTELASDDASLVRLYVASALQRLALAQRWPVAEALLRRADDAGDHNLPLMIWYAVEPLVTTDVAQAMHLAKESKIPLVARYIARRAAADSESLHQLVASLDASSADWRRVVLQEMLQAFEGRVEIPMPAAWEAAYESLLKSEDQLVRHQADQVAVSFGDRRILPRMRAVLADANAELERRTMALDVLIRGRDADAAPALLAILKTPQLRGRAIRALAAYDHDGTAKQLISLYSSFTDSERRAAIGTLTSRAPYAHALLDAVEKGDIARVDVHAYDVRQLRNLKSDEITQRLGDVWGTIRESTADKKEKVEDYKRLIADSDSKPDLALGRAVFNKTCASCHKLFGEGGDIGPDITGSNRANLDYILENVVDPSAVVGRDYKMTTLLTEGGRVVTGLIERETDSAYTVRTATASTVIAKSEVVQRSPSELSLMPEGQLDQLTSQQVRNLVAYLASASQVALPKVLAPIGDDGLVPHALEGESFKVLSKTGGTADVQPMQSFKQDRWSGGKQLWWRGQPVGARLDLQFQVAESGTYLVEVVLTRARDYGVVELFVDDQSLGSQVDCYVPNRVDTTGVLTLPATVSLQRGDHRLSAKITAKHAQSQGTMFGLDYVRLVPVEQVD